MDMCRRLGLTVLLCLGAAACRSTPPRPPVTAADLFFQVHGTGTRPILMLHGFGTTSYEWRKLIPELSRDNRVFVVDMKGYGRSSKPEDGRYSLFDQGDLISQFILEKKLTGLVLVGHSMGGGVALVTTLKLMRSHPGVISSLIVMDPTAYDRSFPVLSFVLRNRILGPIVQGILPPRFQVRRALKYAYFDDSKITDDQIAEYAASLSSPGGRYAIRETARDIVPDDPTVLTSQYPNINIPTLILWGKHDEVLPPEMADRLHRAIPQSELVVIDGAGHIPNEETPEPVLAAIRSFLANAP